jgi:putative oxidoreductase
VHSTDPRLPAQVRELTHGLGADAVWDCVGGNDFFKLSLACTRLGGTGVMPVGGRHGARSGCSFSMSSVVA